MPKFLYTQNFLYSSYLASYTQISVLYWLQGKYQLEAIHVDISAHSPKITMTLTTNQPLANQLLIYKIAISDRIINKVTVAWGREL